MKKLLLSAAITAALSPVAATAGPLIIDDFSSGFQVVEDTSVGAGGCTAGTSIATGCFDSALGTMLGGERDIFTNLVSGTGVEMEVINASPNRLNFSVDTLSTGTGVVTWDGTDGSIAVDGIGLGNFDLTNGGSNSMFAFDVLFADSGFNYEINIWDGTSGAQVANGTFLSAGTTTAVTRTVDFSDAAFASVNFADVGALQFVFDPGAGFTALDLSSNGVFTVPEPTTLAAFSLGLIGVGFATRKRNKA